MGDGWLRITLTRLSQAVPPSAAGTHPLSRGRSTLFVQDDRLAWRLVDEIADALPDAERIAVFVDLGAGDVWAALMSMLSIVARDGLLVSAGLLAELSAWLDDGYSGTVEATVMRELLARMPSI